MFRRTLHPSLWPCQGIAEPHSPFHGRTVTPTCCSPFPCRKKIRLTTWMAGQAVGIQGAEEGIWLASFVEWDSGYADLEERTLQPRDAPFSPRASPMS